MPFLEEDDDDLEEDDLEEDDLEDDDDDGVEEDDDDDGDEEDDDDDGDEEDGVEDGVNCLILTSGDPSCCAANLAASFASSAYFSASLTDCSALSIACDIAFLALFG